MMAPRALRLTPAGWPGAQLGAHLELTDPYMSCDGSRQEIVRPGCAQPARGGGRKACRLLFGVQQLPLASVSRRARDLLKRVCSVLCGYCASFVGEAVIDHRISSRTRSFCASVLACETAENGTTKRIKGTGSRSPLVARPARQLGEVHAHSERLGGGLVRSPLVNSRVHDQIPRQVRRPHTSSSERQRHSCR